MKFAWGLAMILGLASFTACAQCRDKLGTDGKHFECNKACVQKNENDQPRHDRANCYCSSSCPCMAVPAKEEPPKK